MDQTNESSALPSPPFFLANFTSLSLVAGSTLQLTDTRAFDNLGLPVWLGRLPPQVGLSFGGVIGAVKNCIDYIRVLRLQL